MLSLDTHLSQADEYHSMLNTTNYTRTLWNRDSYRIPTGSNLYGYVEHPPGSPDRPTIACHLLTICPEPIPFTTTTVAITAPTLSSC
jgi:hypothetical protein